MDKIIKHAGEASWPLLARARSSLEPSRAAPVQVGKHVMNRRDGEKEGKKEERKSGFRTFSVTFSY
jgi:hypothetical protein